MKHLYFMRHGLSEMNQLGIFSSRSDTSLTQEGAKQCAAAGHLLNGKGIDCIVSSPLQRCRDSAAIVAEHLGIPVDSILICDDLAERDFGPLEGTPYNKNTPFDEIDGVETSTQLLGRAANALTYLESLSAETVLVVSHGAVGRALRHITNPTIPFKGSPQLANADPVQFI